MPDLQNFSVVRGQPANINTPTHVIEALVVEGQTTLADFTGENAIRWPSVLSLLTQEQQDEIASGLANTLIEMRRGAQ